MKIIIFGDISSDYPGLRRFFDNVSNESIDKFIHLGDVVHHNSPKGKIYTNKTIELLRMHDTEGVKGNHDKLLLESNSSDISPDNLKYLADCPEKLIIDEALFVHKSPTGQWTFLNRESEYTFLKENHPSQNVVFFGHTHKRLHLRDGFLKSTYFPKFDTSYDVSTGMHMINPGTIDGAKFPFGFNENPSYVLYDTENRTVTFRKIKNNHLGKLT
jgi:predicted phosphodiesterase